MTFKERLLDDSKNTFLNNEQFAEDITYTTLMGAKIIKAVVIRYELTPAEENINRSLKKQAEVFIAYDADEGVVVIDKMNDRITLKDTEGTEREARINDVINRDEGMWRLMVGW